MADALAISAAVVQFLDIAVRLTLQLSSLYKQVQDVPEKLQHLQADIDQQITIARYVQSTHATFWNASPPTTVVSMSINQPLTDYVAIMEQLLETVRIITKPNDTGVIRRSWSALRAMQKCKDAIILCDALEKKKSNITMWLSTANLELSSEILKLVNGVDKKIDQTLHLGQRLEEASGEELLQLSRLPNLLADFSINAQSTLSLLSEEASSSQRQVLALAANTEANVRILTEQWQELSPTFHEFRNILQHSSQLQQHVRQVASNARYPLARDSEPHDSRNSEVIPRVRLKNVCTCRDIVRTDSNESIPFIQFRKIFRQYHFRHCPRWRSSATSLEYLVKIIPPTWLLAHTVHLGFCIQSWNSKTSWKIAPLIIGGSRRVDRMKSPAFQAIRNLARLNYTSKKIQPENVQDLQRTLKELFDAQQASAYDEDHLGSTLLFETVHLYRWRRGRSNHDPCAQDFVSLIQFLLDSGSDPNIYRLVERADQSSYNSWCDIGGTLLDVFAIPLMCFENELDRYDRATASLVYEKLVDNNAYFSRPMSEECTIMHPTYYFCYFEQQMKQFNTFEEQHEVCNLTDLMISIIHRAEADFDRAIPKGSIHEALDANGLTAIHFAIFWPKGLRQLIRAGANVNCEDRLGRRPVHLAVGCGQAEATLILLEADCSIYTPEYSKSLLQESLRQGRHFDYVTIRIIDTLIDRHTRLIDWVSSLLPESPTLGKHLGQDYIDEMDAPKLIDELVKFKCPLPQSLKVDCDAKGVYDTADFEDRVELTVPLADQLWNGGFRRVDEPARLNDLTPLLQSWYMANFEMVSWFVEKGASPFTKSPLMSHSGLHLFAARIAYPGEFSHDRDKIPCNGVLIKQLTDDANTWHDLCRCLCSPSGCTPISIAVKQFYYHQDERRDHKMMMKISRWLHKKLLYLPEENPDHTEQLLRILIFEKLQFRHTCCYIGQEGETYTRETWKHSNSDSSGSEEEFHQCLAKYTSKMVQCGCDIIYKPACAVYREKCEKSFQELLVNHYEG